MSDNVRCELWKTCGLWHAKSCPHKKPHIDSYGCTHYGCLHVKSTGVNVICVPVNPINIIDVDELFKEIEL